MVVALETNFFQPKKEQEDERIRKNRKSEQKETLEKVTDALRKAKPGQRAKLLKEIQGG